jgi:sulfatase modifying factor 1
VPSLETGAWPEAAPTPCARASPAGAVCVPGGVFFLGGDGLPDAAASLPERLVRLGPLHVDAREVTVAEARELVDQEALGPLPTRGAPGTLTEACRYTTLPGDAETAPLNCVSLPVARELCAARGGRLPSEAEWEYVAGDGALERTYPFGESELDLCAMAAVGRGRNVQELDETGLPEVADCRGGGEAWGPVPSGEGPSERDVTRLGVHDLAGNVSEWVEGRLGRYDDPCWGSGTLLESPLCTEPALYDAGPAIRGGSWLDAPRTTRAVTRRGFDDPTQRAIATGVRCVYDD